MATKLYLTRSEIFAAAWRRFRSMKGAKATPKQHPASWRCCLTLAWAAAKGDAGWLMAVCDDKRREDEARARAAASRAPRAQVRATARAARSYGELSLIRNLAA
jgi:hypothetical protein